MLKELNEQLVKIKADLNLRDALKAKLAKTDELLIREKHRRSQLDAALIKEDHDVKQLEGLTVVALFHAVLGDKNERLEKERQDFCTALLNSDECSKSIKDLEEAKAEYEDQLKTLGRVDEDYEVILKEKAALVTRSTSSQANRLLKIGEQFAAGEIELRQLSEAVHAGRAVLKALKDAEISIQGSLDIGAFHSLGRNSVILAATSSELDNARNAVNQIQRLLHRFELEMSDVGFESIRLEVAFNIPDWELFADTFFCNAVSAWVLAGNLGQALVQVRTFKTEINKLVAKLDARIDETKDAQGVISSEWRQMVEAIDQV